MAVTDAQTGGVIVDAGGGQSPTVILLDASCGKVEVGDSIGFSAALDGWVRADASADADGSDPVEARFVAPLNESPECLTAVSAQKVRLPKTKIPFRTFIAFIMPQE